MKNYKVHYAAATGLRQVNPIMAICYLFQDGYLHFYETEEALQKGEPFKSINKDAIYLVEHDKSAKPVESVQ